MNLKPSFTFTEESRQRKQFRASDFGKSEIDIILELQGVEPTNPRKWSDYLKLAAGKGVELKMLEILKQNGVVAEDYDQEKQTKTTITRNGIDVTMLFDAEVKAGGAKIKGTDAQLPNEMELELGEGEIIEIKSINNKNEFDIRDYIDGKARPNYVGQLAIYMDAKSKEQSHLFVSAIDGLNYFWFDCHKIAEGRYQAGETVVDVNAEYARFADIWTRREQEPNWFACGRYKIPVAEIDWKAISKTDIGKARNGYKIIGDKEAWQITYSPFADKIIAAQGVTERRYSEEELAQINVATKGYTTWVK